MYPNEQIKTSVTEPTTSGETSLASSKSAVSEMAYICHSAEKRKKMAAHCFQHLHIYLRHHADLGYFASITIFYVPLEVYHHPFAMLHLMYSYQQSLQMSDHHIC